MKPCGDLSGHMGIDVGGNDTAMAKEILDDADILTIFQQMRGVGVTKRMRGGGFDDAALLERFLECALQRIHVDMTIVESKRKEIS
jgi:hypothetical protein